MEWGDVIMMSEEVSDAALARKDDLLFGNPWWPFDRPEEVRPWLYYPYPSLAYQPLYACE